MSIDTKIHETQTSILRELLFLPSARFAELQKTTDLQSDQFKFHIGKLVELGHIAKNDDGSYSLTSRGKEYANKLDTDRNEIERQPKSAVIIMMKDGDKVLVQERLKHPYFGFWGYMGGKIRWGETIMEAAAREFKEETNLTATMVYRGVYHEHTESVESGDIIEDKIFHIIGATQPAGDLVESFEGGRNAWMSLEQLALIEKKYLSCDIETRIGLGEASFIEARHRYTKEEF